MLSGHQVLPVFDQALAQAQQQAAALDGQVGALNTRLLELRNEVSEAYRTLARIRLGAPDDDPVIRGLTAVDATVRKALETRSAASAEVDQSVAEIEAETKALKAERAQAMEIVEDRQAALSAAEAAARQRLEATQAYTEALAGAREAAQIASAAEEKLKQAEEDRAEKGEPYEADELFQYLWRRGYGTSAYTAGGLARTIDRWVARLVGYDKARASYKMLQEIPRRLAEHAQRRREDAELKGKSVKDLEKAAFGEGEVAGVRAELEKAEAAVDAIDDKIEASGNRAVAAFVRRAAITRGDDPAMRDATGVIEGVLRQQQLRELRVQAQRTPSPEDDAAVRRLEDLELEEHQLLKEIEAAKAEQEAYRRQMAEIGSVRRDYRQRGFSRGMFDAASGALIGSLLNELLRGGMSRDVFWDRMGQQRRSSPQPGGWGGGWGGSWGGGGGPPSGGGDFRTGGGF